MTTSDWALLISLCSLLIAGASFVWNIWSKFIYPKAAVHTSFGVMHIYGEGSRSLPFLSLSATNYGPGSITLYAVIARRKRNLWDWLRRRRKLAVMNPLHNFPSEWNESIGPFGGGLPKKIDVGESFSAYLTYDHQALRDDKTITGVGFSDTFGRYHWAPKGDFKKVVADLRGVDEERKEVKSAISPSR